ncbi:helix-turn-helix domain-containing protein [Pseudoduganella buxea]|uniref:Helix-turn-helix domain-containing protein n=1 Tax=Pseudoduganella buxea TaxID=1949069 RepID=A0A6I3T8N5_9BURK|nr:AraC family transcriptional regulator [Pseudoduganella buxea]MTV55947.1 helix-turn-helix domain-containing protein [Pseudoduganella buxea]GGC17762.1 hypothetical protein GCM10011572_43860 [Pseudoduganella buxea]
MHEFYNRALVRGLGLLAASLALAWACVGWSQPRQALLPAAGLPWRLAASSDGEAGSRTAIRVRHEANAVRADFRIATDPRPNRHPFAAADLVFTGADGRDVLADLSRHTSLTLRVRCSPANILTLGLPTFDAAVSRPGELLTYRTPAAFFACNETPSRVTIDLTRLETPQWWFDMFKLDLSRQAYTLDRVAKLYVGTTFQSPRDIASTVELGDIVLHGRDERYLWLLGILLTGGWSIYALWFFRAHAAALVRDVQQKLHKDRPLQAYQQLALEPQRDREKAAILRHIATHYADAALDMEKVVQATGSNRNKVNDILKAELGFTFTAYVNKLRLTEAARLLAEKSTATVAEIAYAVGYGNISYFNRLFKEEYGCTPKAFREAAGTTVQAD